MAPDKVYGQMIMGLSGPANYQLYLALFATQQNLKETIAL